MHTATANQSAEIDIEDLLKPIPGDSPTGRSLRYEGTYDQVKEARREDDPRMDQGVWKTDLKKADWSAVEQICINVLQNHSKDLQIAAWLLEAWIHLHGFAGAKYGMQLQNALCERFWDTLHPQIDGEDYEYRVAPVHWINEKLSTALKLIPFTAPEGEDQPAYSFADWESANRTAGDENRRSSHSGAVSVTQSHFQQSALLTPPGYYMELCGHVAAAHAATEEFGSLLDAKLGKESPSISQFLGVLEVVHQLAVSMLAGTEEEEEQNPGGEEIPEADPMLKLSLSLPATADRGTITERGTAIRSRNEAYRYLAEAADYLSKTEPHSPVPYLVRRAISWGSMPLDELLPHLVRSSDELGEIYRLLQMAHVRGKT